MKKTTKMVGNGNKNKIFYKSEKAVAYLVS
jgi:hypothetical protein